MNERLQFLLAALLMYAVLYWLQGGNKPKPATEGFMKTISAFTNMGHDELFMSALCFMLFNLIPFAQLPTPDMWNIIMRLTVFAFLGVAMQEFLSKKGSIETIEWIMGALIPQVIVIMVVNMVPLVTQAYVLMGQAFFGVSQGG